jgi:bacteriocin biosynthesis cyclodehydratase domain-containing protein
MISPNDSAASPTSSDTALSDVPEQLRLAPGRVALWRSPTCLQLGLDPQHAMVLDQLPQPLAALLKRMDGVCPTTELLDEAQAAGFSRNDALTMLANLHRCGLVQEATPPDPSRPGWHRMALAAEAVGWSAHSCHPTRQVLRQRRMAVVRVIGSGRVGVAVATALAAAGVGNVVVQATGTVCAADLVVPEPTMVTELLGSRIPHLVGYAHEGMAVVGPLVWPGRTGCLRCADLYRADTDSAWPKLAAQLVGQSPTAGLACTQLAAALTAEQVLAMLAGPQANLPVPPTWGAVLQLDPVRGSFTRLPRPAHPRCGCGAR